MTISVSQTGTDLTITNLANSAEVVVNEGVTQNGHRGIGSWIKRRLGIGVNGQYSDTKQAMDDITSAATGNFVVPNVVALTEAAAEAALIAEGLVKGTVTGAADPVTLQSIAATTQVPEGTPVNLTLTG